jgi:teichuronic acid biosynthesis glycosyltransferase TuaG
MFMTTDTTSPASKVSIVIPAYNAAATIRSTIDSVLNQTMRDLEVIVVDDCSKDITTKIVNSYADRDKRVRLIELKKNYGGPAGPRNVGVNTAKSPWIAFLDADDIWHPSKLELQLAALQKTGSLFCSTRMRDFENEKNISLSDQGADQIVSIGLWDQLIKPRIPNSSVVADRDLLRRNPFNEAKSYHAVEDSDCWLRCHDEIGRSIKLIAPLLAYRISPSQISKSKWPMTRKYLNVLRNFRFKSGRRLYFLSYVFVCTHILLAIYFRKYRKEL